MKWQPHKGLGNNTMHNNVMWDWQYSAKYFIIQFKIEEYFVEYW